MARERITIEGAKGCSVGAHQCLGLGAAESSRHPITSWRSSPYFAGRSAPSLFLSLSRCLFSRLCTSSFLSSFSLSLIFHDLLTFMLFSSSAALFSIFSSALRFSNDPLRRVDSRGDWPPRSLVSHYYFKPFAAIST